MIKKALPIVAVAMTVAAAALAYLYNRDEKMLKILKANNGTTTGMTPAQLEHWAKL